MDIKKIKIICFGVAISCIVLATAFGVAVVWIEVPQAFIWRSFATLAIFTFSAAAAGWAADLLVPKLSDEKKEGEK